MAIIRKQYYGIRFPFTTNNLNGFFIDLNSDVDEKVASELAHLILTPKGTRYKKPDFGTDVIKFIFDDSDITTWNSVKSEVSAQVGKYIANCRLDDIEIQHPDDNGIYLDIHYTVKKGINEINNRMGIKL